MIINGDCLQELNKLDENSVDAIVTDPPYGLTSITKRFGKEGSAPAKYGKDGSFARLSKGFMGKEWDGSGIEYNIEMWQKCLKVLKPGGYLLAFGGTRTYHRIACAIEDAGFEIRDCIMWLYGSGFPKNMNIGLAIDKKMDVKSKIISKGISGATNTHNNSYCMAKQARKGKNTFGGEYEIKEAQNEWKGWGTALKPSYEPIIVARKPFKGSLVDNVMKYGVGGLNIDECRVAFNGDMWKTQKSGKSSRACQCEETTTAGGVCTANDLGRFPANTILTYDEDDYDEVCGGFPQSGSGKGGKPYSYEGREYNNKETSMFNGDKPKSPSNYNGNGSASRYFYCAKASRKDRDEGLEEFEKDITDDGRNKPIDNPYLRGKTMRHNTHPTVKPTSLMQYLVRLVCPKGATILDPFMGSGSTGKAVMYENKERDANYKFIGIEKDAEYCKIAEARIKYVGDEDE